MDKYAKQVMFAERAITVVRALCTGIPAGENRAPDERVSSLQHRGSADMPGSGSPGMIESFRLFFGDTNLWAPCGMDQKNLNNSTCCWVREQWVTL